MTKKKAVKSKIPISPVQIKQENKWRNTKRETNKGNPDSKKFCFP